MYSRAHKKTGETYVSRYGSQAYILLGWSGSLCTCEIWLVTCQCHVNISQVGRRSWRRNLTAWLFVPLGVILILLACWGVDRLISISSVSFPASVSCMIILFAALCLCDLVLGDRKTRELVSIVDVPVSIEVSIVFFSEIARQLTSKGGFRATIYQYLLHPIVCLVAS